jgi:cell wall-associated NlpC family hydrolase
MKLFDGVAQKYDGTLALLRAQTANELQATMQQQTQVIAHLNEEIARLRTRLSAAEGRHVDAALINPLLGVPWKLGSDDPAVGLDCAGLVR